MDDGESRVLSAPAKINLCLHVRGRRADGYHELVSRVAFADLHDQIIVTPVPGKEGRRGKEDGRDGESGRGGGDRLSVSGPFAAPDLEADNLILRALALFRETRPDLPFFRINLHKRIPVAAGLGGGSADAAAILRFLAAYTGQEPLAPPMERLAARLGADIPACLDPRSRLIRGTGTDLDPPAGIFRPRPLLLVNPGIPVSTAAVFKALAAPPLPLPLTAIETGEEEGRESDRNDLEAPARRVAPAIGQVLDALSALPEVQMHPTGARLSGSGATCFTLFPDMAARDRAQQKLAAQHPHWWIHAGILQNWNMPDLM